MHPFSLGWSSLWYSGPTCTACSFFRSLESLSDTHLLQLVPYPLPLSFVSSGLSLSGRSFFSLILCVSQSNKLCFMQVHRRIRCRGSLGNLGRLSSWVQKCESTCPISSFCMGLSANTWVFNAVSLKTGICPEWLQPWQCWAVWCPSPLQNGRYIKSMWLKWLQGCTTPSCIHLLLWYHRGSICLDLFSSDVGDNAAIHPEAQQFSRFSSVDDLVPHVLSSGEKWTTKRSHLCGCVALRQWKGNWCNPRELHCSPKAAAMRQSLHERQIPDGLYQQGHFNGQELLMVVPFKGCPFVFKASTSLLLGTRNVKGKSPGPLK